MVVVGTGGSGDQDGNAQRQRMLLQQLSPTAFCLFVRFQFIVMRVFYVNMKAVVRVW